MTTNEAIEYIRSLVVRDARGFPVGKRDADTAHAIEVIKGTITRLKNLAFVERQKQTSNPPIKEWQGLTRSEVNEIWQNNGTDWESIKVVEAALKKKNT